MSVGRRSTEANLNHLLEGCYSRRSHYHRDIANITGDTGTATQIKISVLDSISGKAFKSRSVNITRDWLFTSDNTKL